MCSVNLIEAPQQIFGCFVDIITTGVVGEVVPKRRAAKFLFEDVDLVEEQDDTCTDEPSGVDDRVEEE